ncbi:hypothetical protein KVV02_006045 [Mortierella alpina]|uniref:Uncharacterized protein n=1 Tax=Mortierella alpina TaxID=64518 RepID=A0A9P8A8U2_MORAP|nr:hypothetical protein KVV02_006045 [Mortierella alpina]
MHIATGSPVSPAEVSRTSYSTTVASHKEPAGIFPSPPLSPHQDVDVFGPVASSTVFPTTTILPSTHGVANSPPQPHTASDSSPSSSRIIRGMAELGQAEPRNSSDHTSHVDQDALRDHQPAIASAGEKAATSPLQSPSDPTAQATAFPQAVSSAIDADIPILPSQLRKRHESMKALAKEQLQQQQQQQQQQQEPERQSQQQRRQAQELQQQPDVANITDTDHIDEGLPINLDQDEPIVLGKETLLGSIGSPEAMHRVGTESAEGAEDTNEPDRNSEWLESVPPSSYHSSGALLRAKSFSMFESSSHCSHSGVVGYRQQQPYHYPVPSVMAGNRAFSISEVVMPTRDWVQMQTRIQSLETEIGHVSRTNQLLNQELDTVSGHLRRLTSAEGEGWRKEYEFLVQQVDLMHRQLQDAHYQSGAHHVQGNQRRIGEGREPGMTRQLHAEVKDLTASLRTWQAAYQQAEENYRRKCDGERALKQSLRERENQLSSLVDKLSGYESEFKKSISNYEELMRLSSELEALEGKHKLIDSNSRSNSQSNSSKGSTSMAVNGDSLSPQSSLTHISGMDHSMPGLFPDDEHTRHATAVNADQLTVSILSWAALLATYILS